MDEGFSDQLQELQKKAFQFQEDFAPPINSLSNSSVEEDGNGDALEKTNKN